MNAIVQAAISQALASLAEEVPTSATKLGDRQIERKINRDLTEVAISKTRDLTTKKLDGNISDADFYKVW